jgi:hypothetical protein
VMQYLEYITLDYSPLYELVHFQQPAGPFQPSSRPSGLPAGHSQDSSVSLSSGLLVLAEFFSILVDQYGSDTFKNCAIKYYTIISTYLL